MKKRIISLLLVVSMVLSLLPVSALAAGIQRHHGRQSLHGCEAGGLVL